MKTIENLDESSQYTLSTGAGVMSMLMLALLFGAVNSDGKVKL